MKKYHVFIDAESGAVVLVSENSPEFGFYHDSHQELKSGNRSECMDFIDNYFYESNIPEELRIFKTVN